ncbi:selenocysteine-specific translation elongation factor [Allorhizocola rhizosphaerae]|uniref:selenocysteine-specific translation elongation factor n=1 Tax=Allorhizocola rhizosphaerae TaxID=1872709 RepID=UPI000E3CA78D|nr:selenocysteine-specific translation elongation factor [Allorhizocola rhizosphaerae]
MHVIATAGHVDHGKSALLKALTGMEPDRWEEERRRGLTIDLGFVWTGDLAFVDVPGHERFVGNMLAGVGSVPAVLFVVAADEGWMPQSAEHLTALDALGVRHGLLAITKTDLMEPELAAEEALAQIRATSLGDIPVIPVSARTGDGIPRLREAFDDLTKNLPPADPNAPVRLWIDRGFTIHGAGLVVTGTLQAGTIRAGDPLELARTQKHYTVREIQSLSHKVNEASGVARVALNLRGAHRGDIRRGDALMTPGTYKTSTLIDVRTSVSGPAELLVHIGSATVDGRLRTLGADTARLTLGEALPLRLGDRLVLRHDRGVTGGAVILDIDPEPLRRKGAAKRRSLDLSQYADEPDPWAELTRRGIVRADTLRVMGIDPPTAPLAADWLVAPELAESLRARLAALTEGTLTGGHPIAVEHARKNLALPDARLVAPLLPPGRAIRDGMIVRAGAPDALAPALRQRIEHLEKSHAGFVPLDETGLNPADLAAAIRSGRLVRLAPDVVLLATTVEHALSVLRNLPQPFTVSQAREALNSTRKIMVPLLEHLARNGKTRRDADGNHRLL